MKIKLFILLTVFQLSSCAIHYPSCPPQIGDTAPSFRAKTTKGPMHFPHQYRGKWIIFFSHPADFTPVCATEFKRLSQFVTDFEQMNTALVGLSVDPEYIHEIWERNLEKEMKQEGSKESKIKFPIIGDARQEIAKKYGMMHPKESVEQTVRSVYFIDPKARIRAIFHYPTANGRNFYEVKRLLQALQITDKKGVSTPADWEPGRPTIKTAIKKKRAK